MSRLLAEEGLREALWDRGLDETPGVTWEYEQVTWTVPSTGSWECHLQGSCLAKE